MTIRELFREFVVARRRLEDQARRDITQAWWVVRIWMMSHKPNGKLQLPDLHKLLGIKAPKGQSMKQMRAALEMLSARYGGSVRRVH